MGVPPSGYGRDVHILSNFFVSCRGTGFGGVRAFCEPAVGSKSSVVWDRCSQLVFEGPQALRNEMKREPSRALRIIQEKKQQGKHLPMKTDNQRERVTKEKEPNNEKRVIKERATHWLNDAGLPGKCIMLTL